MNLLITFETIGEACDFGKFLKDRQFSPLIMPTPRSFSVSCSYCVVFEYNEKTDIKDFLKDNNVNYSKTFDIG